LLKLGDAEEALSWARKRGVSPFTRVSIFDSPSVTTHVDEDLDYVYVAWALALFNHVINAISSSAPGSIWWSAILAQVSKKTNDGK